jgi:UDP-N-acetylmuramyl pentapeptide phosphotransferase/UDP-N-acetylglucosamine-1-phosphate transferase
MTFEIECINTVMLYPVLVSAGVSGGLVLTKSWHGRFSLDTHEGVQKFHTIPTPRIGGVALFLSVVTAWMIAGDETGVLLGMMMFAGLPAFVAGLIEDFTKRAGVRERLLATMFSGVLASLVTGYHIDHLGIAGIDVLFSFYPLAVLFTGFAVGGVANAINIIDGFNGLASGVLIICFCMFGIIAWKVGDIQLLYLCFLMMMSVFGFMLINFPFGKIFMGDGGAYFMGFMLAWTAVMLPARNPDVSPWASLMVCSYPVIETIFSMWRKSHRNGHHPGQPDKVHFHMLIYQRVSRKVFWGHDASFINGMTTLFIFPFAVLCSLPGVLFYFSTIWLIIIFLGFAVLYYFIYLRLTQFHWCLMSDHKRSKKNIS